VFAVGSFLGSATLENWLSLGAVPPYGLVSHLGAPEALGITLAGLALLAAWVIYRGNSKISWLNRKLLVGAVLLALLATVHLAIAGQSCGIVYGFGLWAAKVATATGIFDPGANAFWSEAVNMKTLHQSVFFDITSITNIR